MEVEIKKLKSRKLIQTFYKLGLNSYLIVNIFFFTNINQIILLNNKNQLIIFFIIWTIKKLKFQKVKIKKFNYEGM